MIFHLKAKHAEEYKIEEDKRDQDQASSRAGRKKHQLQPTLFHMMNRHKAWARDDQRSIKMNRLMAEMMC